MKWAIIGVGNIAGVFMQAVRFVPEVEVVAAYGRDGAKAEAFCRKWGIPAWYTDYDALYEQSGAEVIYLATPHIVHYTHTLAALRHKKHVLCEKPMTMSAEEAEGLQKAARENGVFLMEAMWTRFFPVNVRLRELIASGRLGKPLNVNAEFSFEYPYDENYRFFRRDLGGGSMRSAGVYPLAFACMVFGAIPTGVTAMGDMKNEVDLRCCALLRFPGGGTAELYTGFQGQSRCMANIAFQKGSVLIPEFFHPDTMTVTPLGGEEERIHLPYDAPGMQFEIRHAEECIRAGLTESPVMPLAETVEISRVTDLIYRQIRNE